MLRRKHIAFLKLYEPVHNAFERFCAARCYGEMAPEDLMNETLLIAYEKMDDLESKGAFLSFLCGISLRLLANSRRKMKAEVGEVYDLLSERTGESHLQADDDKELLYKALSLLPEEQREALVLFEITGFKIKEIAEMQVCTEDAVKQRLKRGRDRLKVILNVESTLKTGAL